MIWKKKDEWRVCTLLSHVTRKSPTLSELWLTTILNWKKAKSVPGFNPACPDRMPSLYHLCQHLHHHHFVLLFSLLIELVQDGASNQRNNLFPELWCLLPDCWSWSSAPSGGTGPCRRCSARRPSGPPTRSCSTSKTKSGPSNRWETSCHRKYNPLLTADN